MKRLLYIAFVLLSVTLAGCKDDDDDVGEMTFASEGLFVENYGDSISTTFTYSDVASIGVLSAPKGWNVTISLARKTVTATAPAADSADIEDYGTVTFYGFTPDGNSVADFLQVGKVPFKDLSDGGEVQANSFVVTDTNTVYTFNPRKRGNESTETLNTSYCDILWRSSGMPIGYVHMYSNDKVGFYVNQDDYDLDYDNIEDELVEGNAVIVAYDSSGVVIWSWHIWITLEDPTVVAADTFAAPSGSEFMNRNLGAFTNSNVINTADGYGYDEEIMRSYGLYYQWGRKDPFIYPSTYNASGGYDSAIYNEDGSYVPHTITSRTSTTGTISYTTQYPDYFISGYSNWLSSSDDTLWGGESTKSIYDPCPKGWRVPSESDFAGMNWNSSNSGTYDLDEDRYGAWLGSGSDTALFMGVGLKAYLTGYTQNLSGDDSYKQWSGNYWCRETSDDSEAKMFNFYLDHDVNEVVVNSDATSKKANALQIRCVRE